jgi:hypothetical protein
VASRAPHVIWVLRTQVGSSTGFSPFFLVYGSESILPTNITFGALHIQIYEEGEAEQTRRVDLNSLKEKRPSAVMRQARHDQQLRRYHDRNIKETSLNVGNLVLRRIQKTDACINSLPPEKDPSSSPKSSSYLHIAFSGRWARSAKPLERGTSMTILSVE